MRPRSVTRRSRSGRTWSGWGPAGEPGRAGRGDRPAGEPRAGGGPPEGAGVARPVVLVGGVGAETALTLFVAEGVDARMVATAAELREADRQGIRYTLVHVGPD